jgi:hypothetical protein
MRYSGFYAKGHFPSTGVVEADCKVAIGTRLKRTSMHWALRGSNAIIALSCCKPRGRFHDFWERRSTQKTADGLHQFPDEPPNHMGCQIT